MEITKRKLTEEFIDNLRKVHGGNNPKEIVKKLCKDLISEGVKKLRSSWNPPPYDPFLLAPLRNILIMEKDGIDEENLILEPITEETFNLYYPLEEISQRQRLNMRIAKEIVYSFFSPTKKIYEERIKDRNFIASPEIEDFSKIGAIELIMPEEPFKEELRYLGFSPLTCDNLAKMFDVSKLDILFRMAELAPLPCSIALLEYDNPPQNITLDINHHDMDDIIPNLRELVKSKAQKKDRYRVVLAINSPGFHYSIPLNKSMPPETIFYHTALFNKPLSGIYQMKIDKRKVNFEVDTAPLFKSDYKGVFPPLIAFFKEIQD
ncbi:hypothetical protein KKB18_05150 [bacterium]|nr:hypothetical protein [bacterium]